MPEVHWPRGGSNSDRIMACPGSVNEEAKWPPTPSGAAAIDGTHTHTALEYCLKGNYTDAVLIVGIKLEDHEGEFEVDLERAKRINQALKYIWPKVRHAEMTLWSEAFVDTGSQFGIPMWGGSIDATLIAKDYSAVELIDYKDGGKPVRPITNQLVTYGGGVLAEMRKRGLPEPNTVRVTIIQPKVYDEPQSITYTIDEFKDRLAVLAEAERATLDPAAARVFGDHCTYCGGARAGRCPEFNAGAKVLLDEVFKDVPVPVAGGNEGGAQLQTLPVQLPEINSETPAEYLAGLLDAKPLVNAIIKEAEEEATKRALAGAPIPGQKLVHATTHRKFVPEAKAKLSKMKLKREVYMEEKMKSPSKILSSKAFKALSDARRAKIEELVVKPEGGLVLVPISDNRAPVKRDAASIFADVQIPEDEAPEQPALSFL